MVLFSETSAANNEELDRILQRVLRSRDGLFSHLMHKGTTAHLFRYQGKWEKCPVEGVIYLYRRCAIPSTAIFILNKKAPNDFQLLIDASIISVESVGHFLILHKVVGESEVDIFGLWFHEKQAVSEIAHRISGQIELLRRSQRLMLEIQSMREHK